MQFSVQQLSGGAQYGPRTRVGNWFEDIVLQEERWVWSCIIPTQSKHGVVTLGLSLLGWLGKLVVCWMLTYTNIGMGIQADNVCPKSWSLIRRADAPHHTARYAEFRHKKESGKLAIGFRSRRFNICCQKV
jgi:hypothetical protein